MIKKIVQTAGLSFILSSSLFAFNTTTDVKNITKIFNTVGEKSFPGFKNSKIILNNFDNKLQTDIGIIKINTKNNFDYILYMYYPKGKAIQLLSPQSFKIISNTPKTQYIYTDNIIRKSVKKLIILERKKQIEHLKKQQTDFLKNTTKKNGMIFLSKDPNKNSVIIFFDPNCPYCIIKIKNTNFKQLLKKVNVILIPTPLVTLNKNNKVIPNQSLHPHAFDLTVDILSKIKTNLTSQEKIKIIKHYMMNYKNNNFKRIHNEKARKETIENYNTYLKTGLIQGTPTIIEINKKESKLLFSKFN